MTLLRGRAFRANRKEDGDDDGSMGNGARIVQLVVAQSFGYCKGCSSSSSHHHGVEALEKPRGDEEDEEIETQI